MPNRTLKERWRWVRRYKNIYAVSTFGRVYSAPRRSPYKDTFREVKGRFLKPVADKKGYCRVILWKNGKGKAFLVHRLVLETFLPVECVELEVNHKDLDKRNNKLTNLEWLDHFENVQHAVKHGHVKGFRKRTKVLTEL